MHNSLLSLGSNSGNRKENIKDCIEYLNHSEDINVVEISSLHETSPMYNLNQEDFINCVVEIETSLKPLELLVSTQSIEKKMGRENLIQRNQPRKIDIDILTYNDEIIDEENLKVPHPKIGERKFVLVPLMEIKGNIIIPGYSQSIKELIKGLDKDSNKIIRVMVQDFDEIQKIMDDFVKLKNK